MDTEQITKKKHPAARFNGITERLLLANGYLCDSVESHNAYSGFSKDFLNFADFVASNPENGVIVAVQVTSHSNFSARYKKIVASIEAYAWYVSGARIWILTWRKLKTGILEPACYELVTEDFSLDFRLKFEEYWKLRKKCAIQDIKNHKTKTLLIDL